MSQTTNHFCEHCGADVPTKYANRIQMHLCPICMEEKRLKDSQRRLGRESYTPIRNINLYSYHTYRELTPIHKIIY